MSFMGRSVHNMDAKGRISIPARFRGTLHSRYDNRLVVTNKAGKIAEEDIYLVWLVAYPLEVWRKLEEYLMNRLLRYSEEESFVRYFVGGAVECNIDSQGRILIPQNLRQEAGLKKEVVLSGMLDHFEIWDKEKLDLELKYTRPNFANYSKVVLQARQKED